MGFSAPPDARFKRILSEVSANDTGLGGSAALQSEACACPVATPSGIPPTLKNKTRGAGKLCSTRLVLCAASRPDVGVQIRLLTD